MDFAKIVVSVMAMDEQTWQRHASPWSVYTRIPTIVPLLAAIWSHTLLGWWAIIPLGVIVIWAWLNPRLFSPPPTTDNWASKATFGERIWLNRQQVPIPRHHATMAQLLTIVAAVGFASAVGGAWYNEPVTTIAGGCVSFLAKLWFCDRMVWLFEDMKDVEPRYRSWLRT